MQKITLLCKYSAGAIKSKLYPVVQTNQNATRIEYGFVSLNESYTSNNKQTNLPQGVVLSATGNTYFNAILSSKGLHPFCRASQTK